MGGRPRIHSVPTFISTITHCYYLWQVETVVNKTDREAQLQQVSGLIAQQNLIIPKLEQENAELRVEQAEAIRKKEDLDQKILHATR